MVEAKAMPAPNLGRQAALSAANSAYVANTSYNPIASPEAAATAPREPASKAKSNSSPQVEGYEVKEQSNPLASMSPEQRNWALAGFAVLVALGVFIRSRRRRW